MKGQLGKKVQYWKEIVLLIQMSKGQIEKKCSILKKKSSAGLRKKIPNTNEEGINWKKKRSWTKGKIEWMDKKKHMYDGNKEGTNSKKNSNIEKKNSQRCRREK